MWVMFQKILVDSRFDLCTFEGVESIQMLGTVFEQSSKFQALRSIGHGEFVFVDYKIVSLLV